MRAFRSFVKGTTKIPWDLAGSVIISRTLVSYQLHIYWEPTEILSVMEILGLRETLHSSNSIRHLQSAAGNLAQTTLSPPMSTALPCSSNIQCNLFVAYNLRLHFLLVHVSYDPIPRA